MSQPNAAPGIWDIVANAYPLRPEALNILRGTPTYIVPADSPILGGGAAVYKSQQIMPALKGQVSWREALQPAIYVSQQYANNPSILMHEGLHRLSQRDWLPPYLSPGFIGPAYTDLRMVGASVGTNQDWVHTWMPHERYAQVVNIGPDFVRQMPTAIKPYYQSVFDFTKVTPLPKTIWEQPAMYPERQVAARRLMTQPASSPSSIFDYVRLYGPAGKIR